MLSPGANNKTRESQETNRENNMKVTKNCLPLEKSGKGQQKNQKQPEGTS